MLREFLVPSWTIITINLLLLAVGSTLNVAFTKKGLFVGPEVEVLREIWRTGGLEDRRIWRTGGLEDLEDRRTGGAPGDLLAMEARTQQGTQQEV